MSKANVLGILCDFALPENKISIRTKVSTYKKIGKEPWPLPYFAGKLIYLPKLNNQPLDLT